MKQKPRNPTNKGQVAPGLGGTVAGQEADRLWWREGVIYQIYPRSFCDTNNDGLGDLPGITRRMDYLAELGVDAIWISPFYPTPDRDFGYDVSDHKAVDPRLGTLDDFDRLVAAAHARGIRVVLDLVLNHTSDQHPWFREARACLDNPKRNWYIWRSPRWFPFHGRWGFMAPNNWQSTFGGRAWTYDPATGQCYLHLFTREQPDLNWRNPAVREAQFDVVRFWLARGVDGFRLDVFSAYFKDEALRSNPIKLGVRTFSRQRHIHDGDQPEMKTLLKDLRCLLDSYPQRYAVGEPYEGNPRKAASYCGSDGLHAAFSFDFTCSGMYLSWDPFQRAAGTAGRGARWDLLNFALRFPWKPSWLMKRLALRAEAFREASAWPTTVMSNHDLPRAALRYSRDGSDRMAKIAMALVLGLPGTPFLYYGEEIGMRDVPLRRGEIMDPPGRRYWPFYKGRDGCRSPMQWDDSLHAGFSTVKPWLRINPDFRQRNVAAQRADPDSLWQFTRRLIALRRAHPALTRGDFIPLKMGSRRLMAFLRRKDRQSVLVLLNFSSRRARVDGRRIPPSGRWRLLLSTARGELARPQAGFDMAPYEACLLAGD